MSESNASKSVKQIQVESLSRDELGLPVQEIYETICGEGPTLGLPAVFVRLANCNRTCKWCDTGYVDSNLAKHSGIKSYKIDPHTLASVLRANYDMQHRVLVWTGGEPYMYIDKIVQTNRELLQRYMSIWMETNGELIKYEKAIADTEKTLMHYIISPKLPSSGRVSQIDERLEHWARAHFKYVIGNQEDLYFMLSYLKNRSFMNEVWIQPVYGSGITDEILRSPLFTTVPVDSNQREEYKPTCPPPSGAPSHAISGSRSKSMEGNQVIRWPRVRFSIQMHKYLSMP